MSDVTAKACLEVGLGAHLARSQPRRTDDIISTI